MIKNLDLKSVGLVFIVLLLSCKDNLKQESMQEYRDTKGFEEITINSSKQSEIKESDFISHIDFIKLETVDESIIGKIDKIEMDDKYIYILDRRAAKTLFVFEKNGKFVRKIGKKGKGPGEYGNIYDFVILDDGRIVILDLAKNKLLFYNNFNFTHSVKLIKPIQSLTGEDSYLYFKSLKIKNLNDNDLKIVDLNCKILKEDFPIPDNGIDPVSLNYYFRRYNDSISFLKVWDNKIYRIKGEKILPKYYINFEDKNLTYEEANFLTSKEIKNKARLNSVLFENHRFMYFEFVENEKTLNRALYDKRNHKVKWSKIMNYDVGRVYNRPYFSNNSVIVGIISWKVLEAMENDLKKELGLTSVNITDNPIITLSYFKE